MCHAVLLVLPCAAWGQVAVNGTVTSSVDGRPLPGARVTVKNSNIVTLTGTNGRYSLNAPNASDTVVVAFIGFAQREVPIDGRSIVNVVMEQSPILMQEVVVTGYGTQQRRDITGSVTSVNAEDLPKAATASVEQLLQGEIAGVQVTPGSGRPGDRAIVRIRGIGTLNDASPLYVVDGMLTDDISYLNPSDVASVEVLKDASATAIYGSRGANGVIIVSTKRATLDRPTRFSFQAYSGEQSILHPVDLVNAHDYAILANEMAVNLGFGPNYYFANPDTIGAGTNWQNAIFGTAPTQTYELSSSGGTERTTYYFSGTYYRQQGVLPHSDFNRVTLRVNNDYQLTNHLLFGHNIAFTNREGFRPPDVLNLILRADPTVPPLTPTGAFSDANVRASAGNPMASVFYTRNRDAGTRLIGNMFAELNVGGHLTVRSSFGIDNARTEFRNFVPQFFVSSTQQNNTSRVTVETGTANSWLWENTLTYNFVSERSRLNVLGGVTAQSFYYESLGCSRSNIVGDDENLWYCNAGDAQTQTNTNSAFNWRMLSYLFRANYAFKDRYLFTGTVRVDGSSRFGPANRYGTFPSLAVGWNLKEESFLRDATAVSAFKLRASWGQIGNDKIGPYPAIASVSANQNAVFGTSETLQFGQTLLRLANPDVKWERTTQTDVGADLAFHGDRFEATLDYYRRRTDGILIDVPIPGFDGVDQRPVVNAADVTNSGVEGAFKWRYGRPGLALELHLNGATISNSVKQLGQGRGPILSGGLGNETQATTRTAPGEPIGCFYGFKVIGVYQTAAEIAAEPHIGSLVPGDLRYANTNGDTLLDNNDMTYLGCPIPKLVYGFGARLTWGAFDLSASLSGQAGNKVYNGKKAIRFGIENFETSYLNRWRGPGTSNREPRVTNQGYNYLPSDRFIENGSFVKLQSLQVGYALPPAVTSQMRVQRARIYLSGTNLFQITDYTGYTPEVAASSVVASGIDLGVFPPARIVTLGIDVTF